MASDSSRRLKAPIADRSVAAGASAALGLALFYAAVVGSVGGLSHLREQATTDAPWLLLILAGFGTQVALFAELRRRRRLSAASGAAAGGGGAAAAVGMIACCSHHIVDLVPVIGLSGAAVFLTDYRTPIMLAGIAVNVLGVVAAARRLRRFPTPSPQPASPPLGGELQCSAH